MKETLYLNTSSIRDETVIIQSTTYSLYHLHLPHPQDIINSLNTTTKPLNRRKNTYRKLEQNVHTYDERLMKTTTTTNCMMASSERHPLQLRVFDSPKFYDHN
ncbi:hypothetical protein HELRODRAFT_159318 [Helobdella robusta]|uniref:Uncharacterized protein n=1 Tax=Helobdella robusta TaxID=6412 RepID=T1ENV9_HELRO|nr:hypothetical protein HELRODRAFT_159318 [Helobdella robusta]ESO12735.1 hypothetical protein HELRODRAFT_159318 [Helobdella robusta]